MLVAASTAAAVGRGRDARRPCSAVAAPVIGGGAGGKDILANAGGTHAAKVARGARARSRPASASSSAGG